MKIALFCYLISHNCSFKKCQGIIIQIKPAKQAKMNAYNSVAMIILTHLFYEE
jgi:hypothetical protein